MQINGTFSDERDVIAVCLNHLRAGSPQVVGTTTENPLADRSDDEEGFVAYIRETTFPDFKDETLRDFKTKNKEEYLVDPRLNPDGRLICPTEEELRHVFRDRDGWERFRREYPGSSGTMYLSRVGFDSSMTQAMIYVGHQFHWTAGMGKCYFLSKIRGNWIIEGDQMLWIS